MKIDVLLPKIGNPAQLNPLPPVAAGKKFVEYAGGVSEVIKKAKRDVENGEYRWAAEALNHVVMATPTNNYAKMLLAQAYRQMGYQAESGKLFATDERSILTWF